MKNPNLFLSETNASIQTFDWGRLDWFISGPQGSSTTMTFGRCTILTGHKNPRHIHPNCDEILHLLSGSIEHTLDDERITMHAGDTLSIPMGVTHNARAIGDEPAIMIIAFSSAERQFVSMES